MQITNLNSGWVNFLQGTFETVLQQNLACGVAEPATENPPQSPSVKGGIPRSITDG